MRAIIVKFSLPRLITPFGLSLPLQPGLGWRGSCELTEAKVDMKVDAYDAARSTDHKIPGRVTIHLYNPST